MAWRVGAEDRGISPPVLRNVYRLVSLQQQPSRLEYNGRPISDTQRADGENDAVLFVGGLDEFRETHFPVRDRPVGPGTASPANRVQGRFVRSMADDSYRARNRARYCRSQLSRTLFEACRALHRS